MSQPQQDNPKAAVSTAAVRDDLEIWIVIGGTGASKAPEGCLITTRDRMPKLIAYVPRVDQPGILSAKLIAMGKSSSETEENLRGNEFAAMRFLNKLLVPMDYIERRNRECVAGSFIQMAEGSMCNFVAYTEAGFKGCVDRAMARIVKGDSSEAGS